MTIIGAAQPKPGIVNATGQRIVRRPIATIFTGPPPERYTAPLVVEGDPYAWPIKMTTKRGPVQMRRDDYRVLVTAMEKLARFIDPDHPSCAVPSEAREAARLYLNSWVLAPLEALKEHVEATPGTREAFLAGMEVRGQIDGVL